MPATMPATTPARGRVLRLGALVLLALLALAACNRQSGGQSAESADLRARVERLERDAAQDRERLDTDLRALREDVSALRASLDEAGQHLAALSGAPGASGQTPSQNATASKSPRAALRESLRGAVDASRQALERLNSGLEKSLARPKPHDSTPAPAPEK